VFPVISLFIVVLINSTLYSSVSHAAEVDQFTRPQNLILDDSTALLDTEVNQRINRALIRANRNPPHLKPRKVQRVPKQTHCSVPRLYDSFRALLARPIVGQIESFAEDNLDVNRHTTLLSDSVYRHFTWPQSPSLVLTERVASIVRVGDFEVGTDKFGHFFTEGYSYFRETDDFLNPVNDALLFGEWTESVYFGAQTTGVYSYADLVANFNGLRFWNRILAVQPDPLTERVVEPYIRCENDDWVVNMTFHWVDYIDNGWNESVNCSLFRTLNLLGQVLSEAPHCHPEQLPWRRYGIYGSRLLNQHGLGVMPEYLQPEVLLRQMSPDEYTSESIEWIRSFREDLELWRLKQDEDPGSNRSSIRDKASLNDE
jgi:hypothetical protein